LSILETIAALVTIFGPIAVAIVYIVKLRMDVKHLQEQLKDIKEKTAEDIKTKDDLLKSNLEVNIKVLEQRLNEYKTELDRQGIEISKVVDKYTELGWDVVMQRLKQGGGS
jgi:hypothetical protein